MQHNYPTESSFIDLSDPTRVDEVHERTERVPSLPESPGGGGLLMSSKEEALLWPQLLSAPLKYNWNDGEKVTTKGPSETEGFHELTTLVNDVLKQFQESIIKMIDKVNNKNILYTP
ncbi:hypothetical protein FGIG_03639 [Fasciola gigantica]|uniref:Uncharacterized protein n=1 Tax=Fasciola gigantica TaxID=46835 RepID=A0A504YIA4_FASGI|nr:hypothetical protein FGIG_03639 [Fasciola gigantica]